MSEVNKLWVIKKLAISLELVSKELNHFGVIADLFRQIGGHSAILLFLKTFHYKNDEKSKSMSISFA